MLQDKDVTTHRAQYLRGYAAGAADNLESVLEALSGPAGSSIPIERVEAVIESHLSAARDLAEVVAQAD